MQSRETVSYTAYRLFYAFDFFCVHELLMILQFRKCIEYCSL